MTLKPASSQSLQPPSFRRGDIWMVDFGNSLGTELGMEHPALIVSRQELNNMASGVGRIIVVPGTSTHFTNSQGKTFLSHQEAIASPSNGLHHTTYFMAEQVRTVSVNRCRRLIGAMELKYQKQLDERLCLVMDLFQS